MTVLDWAIVAFTIALGLWGYRQGLIVGFLTLLGFAAGAVIGSRFGPLLLSQGSDSPYAPLCAALGALLIGAVVAVTVESFALSLRARVLARRRFLHLAELRLGPFHESLQRLALLIGEVNRLGIGHDEVRREEVATDGVLRRLRMQQCCGES